MYPFSEYTERIEMFRREADEYRMARESDVAAATSVPRTLADEESRRASDGDV